MTGNDYGPKTGAGEDHPYNDPKSQDRPPPRPAGKDPSTPPDDHTEVDSEKDIGDPSQQ